ncbi:hypothetical protein B5X24_HaOG200974 [Helicoverpa armigera]|nr:hypothetical protein B5X24_HaOG200974 [Helicoverpa armigera]
MFQQIMIKIKNKIRSFYSLNSILFVRLLFGLYYKLSESIIIRLFAKIYCILYLILYLIFVKIYNTTDTDNFTFEFYGSVILIETVTNILFSLFSGELYVMKFLSSLPESDLYSFGVPLNLIICHSIKVILEYLFVPIPVFIGWVYLSVHMTIYNSRMTTVCVMDMLRQAYKSVSGTLIRNIMRRNVTDEEKITEIKIFVKGVMKLGHNMSIDINITRFKVRF